MVPISFIFYHHFVYDHTSCKNMWHKVSLSLLTRILHYDKLTYKNANTMFHILSKNLLTLSKMLVLLPLKLMDFLYKSMSYWVNAIHKQILMEYMLLHFKFQTYIKPIATSHNTPEINRLTSSMFKSLFLPCKPNDNFISIDSSPWSLPIALERVSLCQKKSPCQAIDSFFQWQCIQSMVMNILHKPMPWLYTFASPNCLLEATKNIVLQKSLSQPSQIASRLELQCFLQGDITLGEHPTFFSFFFFHVIPNRYPSSLARKHEKTKYPLEWAFNFSRMPHPLVKKKFHLVTGPTNTLKTNSVGDFMILEFGTAGSRTFPLQCLIICPKHMC